MRMCKFGLTTIVMVVASIPGAVKAQSTTATAASSTDAAPTLTPAPQTTPKQFSQTKQEVGKLPSAAALRPGGAISVTAKRAELIQGSSAVYSGDVVMDSDTLKLNGERLELKQFPGGFIATLTGAPAHMSHPSSGADDPPMTAHSRTIVYDSRNGVADLIGDAYVTKGEQNISADTIHYNVAEKGILASGGGDGDGRVHIVIPPAEVIAPTPGTTAAPAAAGSAEPPK